jgi:hypothetical protein
MPSCVLIDIIRLETQLGAFITDQDLPNLRITELNNDHLLTLNS